MNFLFLILFAAVGGAIAYFADRLGRTLGKKRLSLLGMRPRHTAEFLTVCAGAVIPLITVFTVMALSAGVREWIFDSQKWKQERDVAQLDLKRVRSDLSVQKSQLDLQTVELRKTSNNLEKLKGDESNLRLQVKTQTAELKTQEVQLANAKSQYNVVMTEYNTEKALELKVKGQYEGERKLYAKLDGSYSGLKKDFSGLQGKFDGLQRSYKSLQANIPVLEKQRDAANNELVAKRGQVDELTNQLGQLKPQLDALTSELDQRKDQLQAAQQELDYAIQMRDQLARGFDETRTKPAIFNVGEELARISIPAGTSQSRAEQYLSELNRKASKVASQRGADPKDHPESCGLVEIPVVRGKQRTVITVAQQERAVISRVMASNEPYVVMANALYTTMNGEFVPVAMTAMPDKLVFHKGDKIAETWVSGSLTNEQILEAISNFVKTKVQPKAMQGGMIGAQGHEDGFGEVPAGDILNLVATLQKWGSSARLIALAKQDTRAGDSLELKFDLQQK